MSIMPAATVRSASPRPFAGVHGASLSAPTMSQRSFPAPSLGGNWVYCAHMSTEHNPTTGNTNGSKRPGPGSFEGLLT